jgi:hypothetical protein
MQKEPVDPKRLAEKGVGAAGEFKAVTILCRQVPEFGGTAEVDVGRKRKSLSLL